MRHTRKNGLIMTLIAVFAILAMGTTAMAAGIGGAGTDLPFFAQNGNGNGGRSGENPPQRPGTGNNGQGQGVEHGNPPADPGSGNNRQGGQDQGEDEVAIPVAPEQDEDAGETVEIQAEDADADAAPVNPAPEKLEVCHVTGTETEDAVLITISSRAVPAHVRHGDTVIGEMAEATCGDTAEDAAAVAPEASPAAGETEGGGGATGETVASPTASPMASPAVDDSND